jgi:cytochrome c2
MTGSDLAAKDAALQDPAITRKLIKAGAVVGVKGFYATSDAADDQMIRVGVTCALCHQVVKPTTFQLSSGPAALPIGPLELDGMPNARMDAGKILSFTPFAIGAGQATVDLLAGWGPNRFDIRALPDNAFEYTVDDPTDTPPIWNFVDLEAESYPFGWDGLFVGQDALASQAEAVYDVVMHANGAFGTANGTLPPALRVMPPQRILDGLAQAEAAVPGNDVDRQKLLDLQEWMRSITSPAPGAFDEAKAEEGFRIFNGKGACNTCHTTPELSGTKSGPFLASITATSAAGDLAGGIKVPSLRGVSRTAPYFHDDSAATLADAVERVTAVVSSVSGATFSADEKAALVEYLKSL